MAYGVTDEEIEEIALLVQAVAEDARSREAWEEAIEAFFGPTEEPTNLKALYPDFTETHPGMWLRTSLVVAPEPDLMASIRDISRGS